MNTVKNRILYVEDDPDSRELVVMLLKSEGYDVTVVEQPADVIPLARNERFDLFFLDNWMPELSGVELSRTLREFNQTTPILFYSAATYKADIQEAHDSGPSGYLTKPSVVSELTQEIARLIAQSS